MIGAVVSLAAAAAVAGVPVAEPATGLQPPMTVASAFVPARTVQLWLPAGYDRGHARYSVIYMTDGQNVFDTPAARRGMTGRFTARSPP